ncbi:Glycosyltransferase involved in cell wall bisynthesis [Afipia sp. GAS231]|nr:Glycosyltransferase involved in cell wall bisynthesis [Afipia sp. GAS231]
MVTQHYAPDPNTTAIFMTAIAEQLALESPVVVFSGWSGSAAAASQRQGGPHIIEIRNWMPAKAALVKRAAAELWFSIRVFFILLMRLQRGDVVVTVTAPFMLPYSVAAAAWLRRARSVLILHDLFPDVLVMAGLMRPRSIAATAIHAANALMYRALSAVIVIGRDTTQLLKRYKGVTPDKICFIPNWATLPIGLRPIESNNSYRQVCKRGFIVGLSGNLGFTHDPLVVFEAARMLLDADDIGFLLSGWGTGFESLQALQAEAKLPNVVMMGRVPETDLAEFLASADLWIIPYRKNAAGVSVPSRFYNLLAIGRPVAIVSEANAEAAVTIRDNDIGWVVPPGNPAALAAAIRAAASSGQARAKGMRAVEVAGQYSFKQAMTRYRNLVHRLLEKPV